MLGKAVVCIAVTCLVLAPILDSSYARFFVASIQQDPSSTSQDTGMMQQVDHQRRLNEQRKAEAERRQMDAVATPDESSAGLDYAILVLLAASGLVVFVVSRKRNQARPVRRIYPPLIPPR